MASFVAYWTRKRGRRICKSTDCDYSYRCRLFCNYSSGVRFCNSRICVATTWYEHGICSRCIGEERLRYFCVSRSIELEPIPPLLSPMRMASRCVSLGPRAESHAPRRLLQRVPGLELVNLTDADACCGSAGTYNIEQPEIAKQLGVRKAQTVLDLRCGRSGFRQHWMFSSDRQTFAKSY